VAARTFHRRQILSGAAASALAGQLSLARGAQAARALPDGLALGPARPFSFQSLADMARSLAGLPWRPAAPVAPDVLGRIDYDAFQEIRYRRDMSFTLDSAARVPIQLFHLGNTFKEPVKVHLVDAGDAREVLYRASLFEIPARHPARELPDGVGFAGFRVMSADLATDWLAFLGASYFRASGPYNQYGLSARGLAIDTGLATPEEFPRFTEFWLERGAADGAPATICAMLDSPRAAGAYRMRAERTTDERNIHRVTIEIEAELFARADIARLGISPFSSMFWYGETSRNTGADWRPEIHDSDGLAIWTGADERIWRPLNNPPRVTTNAFLDRNVKGFGLFQRDRDYVHFLDDSVFYERRPSVWTEPLEPWGEGAVHLLEIPTDDEIHDNIAAYWCPKDPFRAGERRRYRYRLTWLDDISFSASLARATATWTGRGGRPGYPRPQGVRKFVIDFQGSVFAGLGRDDGVEIVVMPSRGTISNAYAHPVVDQRERWRAFFDLEVSSQDPVDLRVYLRKGERALTETWVYQYFPEG
jgi:glucans biosynthesis protein